MPTLEVAMERMPVLATAGIKRVVNGAITYTPDGSMLLGPAPGLPNFWCACGVAVGVAWGPGIGKYLAQWMIEVHGAQTSDGRFPDFAPHPYDPSARFSGSPGWADAGVFVPFVHYLNYHDLRFAAASVAPAVRWLAYVKQQLAGR